MDQSHPNATRVATWLDAINVAKKGPGIHTLRDEYHRLFRPDAVLYVPGDTQISGRHIGFEGWLAMATRGFEIASDNVKADLEQVVANEAVCAAIIHYTFERPGEMAMTRATELRWFAEDGLVYEGEFMASDWAGFSHIFGPARHVG